MVVKAAKPTVASKKAKPVVRTAKKKVAAPTKKRGAKTLIKAQPVVSAEVSKPILVPAIKPAIVSAPATVSAPKHHPAPIEPSSIPPILLEGDFEPLHHEQGPGQRYALGPVSAPAPALTSEPVPILAPAPAPTPELPPDLPESYETEQLFLAARDPHWLFAVWDLSSEQIHRYNALARDGRLALKIFKGSFDNPPLAQISVHPESRNWFVPVNESAAKYMAELGYISFKGKWSMIARSTATFTPPDSQAEEEPARFVTLDADVPLSELSKMVQEAVREHVPLVEAIQQLRAEGYSDLPSPAEAAAPQWTPAQEHALQQAVSIDQIRRVWIGSLEVTELVRRQMEQHLGDKAPGSSAPEAGTGASASISSLSNATTPSVGNGSARGKGFWFNVNAELIIYGATEPGAKVVIGGAGNSTAFRRQF